MAKWSLYQVGGGWYVISDNTIFWTTVISDNTKHEVEENEPSGGKTWVLDINPVGPGKKKTKPIIDHLFCGILWHLMAFN